MGTLAGLPRTKGHKECEYTKSPNAVIKALRGGIAATWAGDYGAINVWIDDEGKYSCLSCRQGMPVDDKQFNTQAEVKEWTKKWIPWCDRYADGSVSYPD